MKQNQITEENIKILVDTFYERVQQDPSLGPIFNSVIEDRWPQHLSKMYDFWSSIMLRSRRFHGNPMQKHRNLPYFEPELFNHWLNLFHKTADDIFEENISKEFKIKSTNIATSLKAGMYNNSDLKIT